MYQNQLPKCSIRILKSKILSNYQKLSDFKVQKQNFCKTQLTLNNNIYVYLTKCCPKIPKLASKVPNQKPQKQKPKQLQPSKFQISFSKPNLLNNSKPPLPPSLSGMSNRLPRLIQILQDNTISEINVLQEPLSVFLVYRYLCGPSACITYNLSSLLIKLAIL